MRVFYKYKHYCDAWVTYITTDSGSVRLVAQYKTEKMASEMTNALNKVDDETRNTIYEHASAILCGDVE